MSETSVTVRLTQRQDYQFDNQFGDGLPELLTDEPAPLGQGSGPSPMQLLCALRKLKQPSGPIACEIQAEVGRNADKRLRVLAITAQLTLGVSGDAIEYLARVMASFEDYCTVTGSVRAGIPVTVKVYDVQGVQLK